MHKKVIQLLIYATLSVLLVDCTAIANKLEKPAADMQIIDSIKPLVEEKARAMNISMEEAYRQVVAEDPIGTLQAELMVREADTFAGLWIQHDPEYKVIVTFTRNGKAILKPYVKYWSIPGLEVRTARVTYADLEETERQWYAKMQELCLPFSTMLDVIKNQVTIEVTDQALLDSSLKQSNLTLPDFVKTEVIFDPLAVKTPAGLKPPADIYFPKIRAQSAFYMAALLTGTLVEKDGCLRVINAEWGANSLIIWQTNYFLNDSNGTIEIVGPDGTVLGRVGEEISLGGGEIPGGPDLECQLLEPIPAQCPGPYFLMGDVVRGK